MTLKDELLGDISRIARQNIVFHEGLNIPANLNLVPEGGLRYDATVLCANIFSLVKPVSDVEQKAAAIVTRIFLRSTCRLITANGGTVTGFDSSKVMGIFLGDMRNTNATLCALKINYVLTKMVKPFLKEYFLAIKGPDFSISHCVGIDAGSVVAIRAGLIGLNDLVWIGRAPALAAKLSQNRDNYNTYISEAVFFMLFEQAKFSPDNRGRLMWEESQFDYQGEPIKVYRSAWCQEP